MPSDDLRRALRPFGWVCGPGFERRYHSDPWVFNLANAIEKLTARAERAEAERDAARAVIRRYVEGWWWDEKIGTTDLYWFNGHDDPEPLTPIEVAEIHAATRQPQGTE